MHSTIFFPSSGNYRYMYDLTLGIHTLCHPLIEKFCLHDRKYGSVFMHDTNVYMLALLLYWFGTNQYKSFSDILRPVIKNEHISTGTCLPFYKKLFVNINHEILPCERAVNSFPLGEVTDKGVSIDWDEIAERYNKKFDKLYERQCRRCYRTARCTQCILELPNLGNTVKCEGMAGEKQFSGILGNAIMLLEKKPGLFDRILHETKLT